jgi:drug/metabolite transporter (DMT)-like permease
VAFVVEGVPRVDWSLGLVINVLFQGMMVSGFAIWGQMTVLRSYPAISTTLAFMAVPVIGLMSSAIVVDEQLTAAVLIGLVLVLAGVAANRIADMRW